MKTQNRSVNEIGNRVVALISLTGKILGFNMPLYLKEVIDAFMKSLEGTDEEAARKYGKETENRLHGSLTAFFRNAVIDRPATEEKPSRKSGFGFIRAKLLHGGLDDDLREKFDNAFANLLAAVNEERGGRYDRRIEAYNALKETAEEVADKKKQRDRTRLVTAIETERAKLYRSGNLDRAREQHSRGRQSQNRNRREVGAFG